MGSPVYTQKPKSGKGRLAWERFEREKGYSPYSVSYTPSYQFEIKGWVCEWHPPGTSSPAYAMQNSHTFYQSSEL